MFPPKRGVSKTYSLIEILTAKPVDYKKSCKISFGGYSQAIHETNPTNVTTPRTLGVVYLRALDKLQGVFEVMGLLKGKIISCCKVIPIPITQEFIDRYESLSDKDIIKSLLKFKYSKEGTIYKDDDENDDDNG